MVKLEKYIFDLNGRKLELTPEEVEDLYLQLKKFHGEKEYIPIPQPYPVYPDYHWHSYGTGTKPYPYETIITPLVAKRGSNG